VTKSQAIKREMEINRGRPTRCHVCGCTYENGCPLGCGWSHRPGELPICSVCAEMGVRIAMYLDDSNRVTTASLGRLLDLARKSGGAVGRGIDWRHLLSKRERAPKKRKAGA
jgi:hypothetical protein